MFGDGDPRNFVGRNFVQHVARVDMSGSDHSGKVGDWSRPFKTVQAAIRALELVPLTPPSFFNRSTVYISGLNDFEEDLTTSLTILLFKRDIEFAESCNSITFTEPTNSVYLQLNSCFLNGNIIAQTSGGFSVEAHDSIIPGVTNTAGPIFLYGASGIIQGVISCPGFGITIKDFTSNLSNFSINSAGSNVQIERTIIDTVVDCNTLTLIDARVRNDNNATVTIYADEVIPTVFSSDVARVDDVYGNNTHGVVGDPGKPFATIQAAINAIEALGVLDRAMIDVGNTHISAEDVTTSLAEITFRGTATNRSDAGNQLTLTNTTDDLTVRLVNLDIGNIVHSSGSNLLQVVLENAAVGGGIVTNGNLSVLSQTGTGISFSDIIAVGDIYVAGVEVGGTIQSTGAGDIVLRHLSNSDATGEVGPTIDSSGSEVWATGFVLDSVVACGILHLIDSRVAGTNNATSKIYADILLYDDPTFSYTTFGGF